MSDLGKQLGELLEKELIKPFYLESVREMTAVSLLSRLLL